MKIAIDAFGGDDAPGAMLEGCCKALSDSDDFDIIITGDETLVSNGLKTLGCNSSRIEIVHAPMVISCEEQPTIAIKRKKDSSLVKALELVANGGADAFVSAGSTGAVLAGANR